MNLECSKLKPGELIMFRGELNWWNHYLNGNYGIVLSIDERCIEWYNFKHKQCFYTYENQFSALKKVES